VIKNVLAQDLVLDSKYDLQLTLLAGQGGLKRKIKNQRIQKPGLALAGYVESVNPHRVQILGNTELTYLQRLDPFEIKKAIRRLFNIGICCAIVTTTLEVPQEVVDEANETNTPLFVTQLLTSSFIARIQSFLEDNLQVATSIHGVLCDVLGVGVLLLGKSSIGKSEAALDLVLRGHRLVADDVIEIKLKGSDAIYGSGAELIRHNMEIRGLGIINIKEMFGVASVRTRKKIELVVELEEWDENKEYERIGIDDHYYEILDVRIPKITLPVRPGRNMAAIIEVAARNQLLKLQGYHAARTFQQHLTEEIERKSKTHQAFDIGDDIE